VAERETVNLTVDLRGLPLVTKRWIEEQSAERAGAISNILRAAFQGDDNTGGSPPATWDWESAVVCRLVLIAHLQAALRQIYEALGYQGACAWAGELELPAQLEVLANGCAPSASFVREERLLAEIVERAVRHAEEVTREGEEE
jgi:hypothetical protein